MDVPAGEWANRLGLALKLEGAVFMAFWFLAYTMKFGMIWQDSAGPPMGPPFFASPDVAAWNFNMILAVYFVLGVYMFKAGDNPAANKNFIGFVIWGNFAHLLVTVAVVAFNDDPAYSGPWPLSGVFGDIPDRVWGIAHWQNLFGDMPLVGAIVAADAYMAKQAFGSYLLPWESY